MTDDLTGVLERRAWESGAERVWERARQTRRPLALALVDLDRFKDVNDIYGHPAGDEVLRATGEALRRCEGALVGRYGRHTGDEFLVLLPDTDLDGALAQARRLRRRIRELAVTARVSRATTATLTGQTASVGLAACVPCPTYGDTLTDLLLDADVALREAKRRGRDQIRCTTGGPEGGPGPVPATDLGDDPAAWPTGTLTEEGPHPRTASARPRPSSPAAPLPSSDPRSGEVRVPLAPYSRDPRHRTTELVMSQAAAEHLHAALAHLLGRTRPAAESLP